MGLLSAIGRAAPLVIGGVAAGWYLRRQGYLGGPPRAALPPPTPQPAPAVEPPPAVAEASIESTAEEVPAAESEHDPGAQTIEWSPDDEPRPEVDAHVEAVEAVSDAADVTSVVEDLLAAAPDEVDVAEAEVVGEPRRDDPEIADAVRLALAGEPGLLTGSVDVEVVDGVAWLRGELARPEDLERARRRAASVRGVEAVRSELRLPGEGSSGERRER